MKKLMFSVVFIILPVLFAVAGDIDMGYKIVKNSKVKKNIALDNSTSHSLEVDNVFGGITVTGTDRKDILVEADKTIRVKSKDRLARAEKEVSLDISSENGKITIYVNGPYRDRKHSHDHKHDHKHNHNHKHKHNHNHDNGRDRDWDKEYGYLVEYDFRIQVPRHMALDLKTAVNGDIQVNNTIGECSIRHANGKVGVSGLTGDFDVHTANGRILMENIDGSGNAHTANGKVDVSFTRNPAGDCSFHTLNGKVIARFRDTPAAEFRVKTTRGKISSDFPFQYQKDEAPQSKKEGGLFVYNNSGFQSIRIGSGGPAIDMDTMNGSILILKGE